MRRGRVLRTVAGCSPGSLISRSGRVSCSPWWRLGRSRLRHPDDRAATGATNPDPGCASPTDTTEDSEIAAPAGCAITWGTFDDAGFFPGIEITGCGQLLTAWIRPPGTADGCIVAIGAGDWQDCDVRGATVSWMLADTEEHVALAAHLPDGIQCEPATAAVVRHDGKVIEVNGEVPGCVG
jgi:hypothetical protein